MKIRKKYFINKKMFFVAFLFLVILYVTYGNLFHLFYQQDEWQALGIFLSGGLSGYIHGYNLIQILSGSSRIFSLFFQYPAYMLFPFQIWPFALFSLVFHGLNSLLVCLFAYKLTKKCFFACVASFFFLVNSVSSQAVTWFAANTTTLPSTTFLLLSFLLAIIGSEKKKVSLFFAAQFCAIASFLFKESGSIAFIIVPYLYYFWNKNFTTFRRIILQMVPLIVYGGFIAGVNIYRIFNASYASGSFFIGSSVPIWQKLIIHTFLYPLVSLSQLFIPRTVMYSFAKLFQTVTYSHLERFTSSQLGVESIVSDFVSFIFSMCIIAMILFLACSMKKYRRILWFSLFLVLLSFLPFVVLEKQNSYLDSRYFYNGIIGGGLLFSSFLVGFINFFKRTYYWILYGVVFLLIIGSGFFFWKHIQYVQRDINVLVIESSERIQFLKQLQYILPTLPERTVLYVTGNNYGYYGISQLKIPFQQGPGFTFMVWFYRDGSISPSFIHELFLWRVEEQGYKSVDHMVFGYFYDLNVLKQSVKNGLISPLQVIGLYYNTDNKKLYDITKETREKLE